MKKLLLLVTLLASAAAQANIVVLYTEDQINNKVTVAVSGSLDTADLASSASQVLTFNAVGNMAVGTELRIAPVAFDATVYDLGNYYRRFSSQANVVGTYDPQSGDLPIVLAENGGHDQLRLSQSYVSGSSYSSHGVFQGKSFADLGFTSLSDVVMNLTATQTLTVRFDQILPTVTAVPEPTTWALMGLGLVGLALRRRRAG